jgi:hypothetical protein
MKPTSISLPLSDYTHTAQRYFNVGFSIFPWVGWDWVHLVRRPLLGLLYQPRMIDESEAVCVIRIGKGKPKYLEKMLPNTTLFIKNPTWTKIKPGAMRWEAGDYHLSLGKASGLIYNTVLSRIFKVKL